MSGRRIAKIGPPIIAFIIFLAIWQAGVMVSGIEKWMLPSPLDIAQEAVSNGGGLLMHTWASVQLTLIGFCVGTAVGLLLACALHPMPWLKRAIYPLVIVSQNIPTIALLPLLMIWFGFGLMPKIVTITLVCFFPVCVATLDGLAQTDRTMMNYMRMAGASRSQLFWKLELPHALPSVFSGLKIAGTYSVMSAIISEWLGTDKGIGYYMVLQKAAYRTDRMFVAIAVVILLSLAMFGLVCALERLLIHWRRDNKQG
ncbi:ABC transporter permease [Paenibacillus alvei]|uniref:ABC transporter permease n=1 Tax=Paenibacillus TaxID=44249 RepID=UPI001580D584|nr:ABC transporter permease [Paenibacillus alvei]